MPYEPQNQNQSAQSNPSSSQSKTAPVAGNIKKDELAAQDRMKNEGGSCSTSDKKSTQGGCN